MTKMRFVGFIISFLMILVGTSFVLLNAQQVEINYFVGSGEYSVATVSLIALMMGITMSSVVMMVPYLKIKIQNKGLKRRLEKSDRQLASYRDQVAKER